MTIYDISRSLQNAPVYPGSAPVEIVPFTPGSEESPWKLSRITADSHMGTHADAFSHLLDDGEPIDRMPLEHYCGKCRVITVPEQALITLEDLRGRLLGSERLVLHSGGAGFLCEAAAEYLVACGVKTVVTDAISIGPEDNEAAIHRILFEGGIAVVENAVLDGVEDGEYLLFAFPVKIAGCDGAPVRAVLISGE